MKQNLELHFSDDKSLRVRDFRVEEAINKPFEIFLSIESPESSATAGRPDTRE